MNDTLRNLLIGAGLGLFAVLMFIWHVYRVTDLMQ